MGSSRLHYEDVTMIMKSLERTRESAPSINLERLANLVLAFFKEADNVVRPGLLDLDPRRGYVRLAATNVHGELSRYSNTVRGLMNPNCDLQAVVSCAGRDAVLTIGERGASVDWQPVC
jgi:hypothetical protein